MIPNDVWVSIFYFFGVIGGGMVGYGIGVWSMKMKERVVRERRTRK